MRSWADHAGTRYIVAVIALLLLVACSSSTETSQGLTPDGFRISLSVSPATIQVGEIATVTMIAENTTSDSIMRAFPPNDAGPVPTFDLSRFTGTFDPGNGFFGGFIVDNAADTLKLAPHAQASGTWHLLARAAGLTTIAACFPTSNDGLLPQVCTSRSITITAH